MMKNMNKIMKQAQALQEKFQQQLEALEVEASSGGGMVTVKMSGNKLVTEVTIDPEVVDPEDVEMLQDLIVAAVNEAARKVDAEAQNQLGSMAGGLKIPGLS
jgi:DNA-binding YbaB/EbfC family protein